MKMLNLKKQLLLIGLLCYSCFALAQDGSLDSSFGPGDFSSGDGAGPSHPVLATATQTDGKILIGGQFEQYNNVFANRIARLHTDGSLDTSFNGPHQINSFVHAIAIQSDGKILVGGDFVQASTVSPNRITRLNHDGSLDTSFNYGTGPNGSVYSIVIQADGKIILGGSFTTYNNLTANGIARLNTNGTLDTSFNSGTGANDTVSTIHIQADGKIILGGFFTTYSGLAANRIARINTNGTLDSGFNSASGANSFVKSLTIQTDGKIIVGGDFTTYNGVIANRITRINTNGTLDTTFNSGTGADASIESLDIQTDGKILLAGNFSFYNGVLALKMTRLNSDGTRDISFNSGITESQSVNIVSIQPDGTILTAGLLTSVLTNFYGVGMKQLTRLTSNGIVDVSFNPMPAANAEVDEIVIQEDGKIIIGGYFTTYDNFPANYIARLNADGTLDFSFNSSIGANGPVLSIALQPDGKILIGGDFTTYDDVIVNRIARLHPDGSLDTSFNTGSGSNNSIYAIVIQPNGQILIGGVFSNYNGLTTSGVIRINSNGSPDDSFNLLILGTNIIYAMALQSDGKLLVGGSFISLSGGYLENIARINSDGSIDSSFNVGSGMNSTVLALKILNDDKIIIAGRFTACNGQVAHHIARLHADGSLDSTFNSSTGSSSPPLHSAVSIAIAIDGKIIYAGHYTNGSGSSSSRLARLNTAGIPDTSFNSGSGANEYINSVAIQSDGQIIIGGKITHYDGSPRNGIARINTQNDLSVDTIDPVDQGLIIYNNNTGLHINTPNNNLMSVSIYDMAGRRLYLNTNINSNKLLIPNLNIKDQTLLLLAQDENHRKLQKKIMLE